MSSEILNNPTERVNREYVEDMAAYTAAPVAPCDKAQALKLLKWFAGKAFPAFWEESVNRYWPAVSEGTMKLAERVYPHDEAIRHAKALIATMDRRALARAFLYGVAHNVPAYRTALACYHYIQNLPPHAFGKKYIGTADRDIYFDGVCETCKYNQEISTEPKMQFWHINMAMHHFYHLALVPFCFDLNTAILFLEEYATLPPPPATREDWQVFKEIIALIEALPENTPPSKLRKALKASGLLTMTVEQIDAFIDMLGYLNILHTADSFGVTAGHTKERDMRYPLSDRSYFAHPVNKWTRRHGIDYGMLEQLFSDLY